MGFYFDGRLSENFKLNTGTWVSVGAVRSKILNAFGGIANDVIIVGEDQEFLSVKFNSEALIPELRRIGTPLIGFNRPVILILFKIDTPFACVVHH